jgi:hypothetical protein
MPHLVMQPFNSDTTQAHSRFASKFGMHKSEEHNESEYMEVNLVMTLESQPIKLEMTFSTGNFLVLQMFLVEQKVLY